MFKHFLILFWKRIHFVQRVMFASFKIYLSSKITEEEAIMFMVTLLITVSDCRTRFARSDTVMGNVIITIFAFPFREKKNLTVWYSNGQCDQNNIRFTISCKASLTVWHILFSICNDFVYICRDGVFQQMQWPCYYHVDLKLGI
jgi:hypothetical protein